MPGFRGRAAIALSVALFAAVPAVAETAVPEARACMDETVRFQGHLAAIPLPGDVREEVARTLVHAHEEAKGGNVASCRDALGRAHRFVAEAGGTLPERPAIDPAPVGALQAPLPLGVTDAELGRLLQLAGLTEIEGAGVSNAAGDRIGDVVGTTRSGDQTLLVIGIGGFLGIGTREVALPVGEFTPGVRQLMLPGRDRASLESLPAHVAGSVGDRTPQAAKGSAD